MIDLTFKTEEGRFNYRVCAIMIHENKLLVMKDSHSDYYFIPGGRVQFNETAEKAILRELNEELNIDASIVRPLYFSQNFFNEDVIKTDFHEIGIYFLIDISNTDILSRGERFYGCESEKHQCFEWLDFDEVKNAYLYPEFIKEKVDKLPETFEIINEFK